MRGFQRLGVRLDRVYHSPSLRAVETAEVLIAETSVESVVTSRLAEAPTSSLIRELNGERIAVVGHQPWLGQLTALLVMGRGASGTWLALEKGAIAWLEGEPRAGGMMLRALLPPKVLRALR